MRTSAKVLVLATLSLLFLVFSCDKSDEDSLTKEGPFNISELAGNWVATQAQFSVSTHSVDVVEDGGTVSMTVNSNGRFTLTIND